MTISKMYKLLAILLLTFNLTHGGPIGVGICYAGCASMVVSCYAAAGVVFGTVTAGVGVAPAVLACNTAQGACYAACTAFVIAPTP